MPLTELVTRVVPLLAHFQPVVIYGFGSFFAGTAREESDIDLAFLSKGEVSALGNFVAAEELSAVLGRDVHLVPLREADAVIRVQVIGTGMVLACFDERARAEFEMYALSDYARLNHERREILQRIEAEGTVFGG